MVIDGISRAIHTSGAPSSGNAIWVGVSSRFTSHVGFPK